MNYEALLNRTCFLPQDIVEVVVVQEQDENQETKVVFKTRISFDHLSDLSLFTGLQFFPSKTCEKENYFNQ